VSRLPDGVVLFIAQGAWSGRSPIAPGTAGTLVAVMLFLVLRQLSLPFYALSVVIFCLVGTWAAGRAEELLGCKDCPSIVIDEIAGYLISLILLPGTWGFMTAAFLLFRVFDIAKPWPLHGLQKVRGGLGVMLDDIGAGIYTNLLLQLAALMLRQG
jgi:phosphatidylglycerophosphatase A